MMVCLKQTPNGFRSRTTLKRNSSSLSVTSRTVPKRASTITLSSNRGIWPAAWTCTSPRASRKSCAFNRPVQKSPKSTSNIRCCSTGPKWKVAASSSTSATWSC
uniref:(northern house mosquito) hypothetical protein n=1 Tax=Culex pipiens TaxID=7175 RepID=A0A8D8MGM7_CULPI